MTANWIGRAKAGAAPAAGLLLLCFLWSLSSLRSDLFPNLNANPLPLMERQALPFVLLAAVAALFAALRKAEWPRGRQVWAIALVGLGLFVAPALLVYLTRQWISELTRVALFSLVPVFAVVFQPYIGSGAEPQRKGSLLAALAAVAGIFCVFPADAPSSIAAGGAFCAAIVVAACVAAANCWAVTLAAAMPRTSIAPMAAIACSAAAAALAVLSTLTEQAICHWDALAPGLAWSTAVDLPALLLLFWLMRRMSAARMTTRFVLAPLMAALFGLALLRPSVELRTGLGMLLAAAGAGWLLFAPKEEADDSSLPLHLNRK